MSWGSSPEDQKFIFGMDNIPYIYEIICHPPPPGVVFWVGGKLNEYCYRFPRIFYVQPQIIINFVKNVLSYV